MTTPEKQRKYYWENLEKERARSRAYYHANKDRERATHTAWSLKTRRHLDDRIRARKRLRYAVRKGRIMKPSVCAKCGSSGSIDAHHYDYNKPLEVEWLCRKCHLDVHHSTE